MTTLTGAALKHTELSEENRNFRCPYTHTKARPFPKLTAFMGTVKYSLLTAKEYIIINIAEQ